MDPSSDVSSALIEAGDLLWGRKFFRKKYSVYFHRGRWVLCDAPQAIFSGRRAMSSVKISVQLVEGIRFLIVTEKSRQNSQPKPLLTRSTTSKDLKDGLGAICESLQC